MHTIPAPIRSLGEALGTHNGEDSPVINETLSVIDEHITDMGTPRHSSIARSFNDSESEYSSHIGARMSYVAGHETDEEETHHLKEEVVKNWSPKDVANYLRSTGVDLKHCDIFEEQEITGDVLLEMDQEFIYMKEFDFGVMGRRLKTWHKVKAFQEEVKAGHRRQGSISNYSGTNGSTDEAERSQSRAGGILPRIPSLMESPNNMPYRPQRTNSQSTNRVRNSTQRTSSMLNSNRVMGNAPLSPVKRISSRDSISRPSPASIREFNHSRRHSSIDAGKPETLSTPVIPGHHKKGSFDREWSMGNLARPGTASAASEVPVEATSPGTTFNDFGPPLISNSPLLDIDRGYFSGGELDNRKTRNVLKKRDSGQHSRQSSLLDDKRKRHSRIGSAESIRDIPPLHTSPAAKAYHLSSLKGRFRSASTRTMMSQGTSSSRSPSVTNLEEKPDPLFVPSVKTEISSMGPPPSSKKKVGLRAISDAVTGNEKAAATSPTLISSPIKETSIPSPARTGSSTPSGASKSFEMDNTDASSKNTDPSSTAPMIKSAPSMARRSKSKKETSAYVRGLEKKTPQEQMANCDYSGWMKKKSSNLMTTWKPRLFILKGRRLSYYYSEDDTEERGLIDISSHRVLRADQDPFVSLHATLTGATSSPTSPLNASTPTMASTNAAANPIKSSPTDQQPFIFKLVPPRSGISRAVQFTKPAVHFFQVDNIHTGRLWMAALMKATIDRDFAAPVESTNKQKTISLKAARAMNQRPPALMVPSPPSGEERDGLGLTGAGIDSVLANGGPESDSDAGLNIRGIASYDDLQAQAAGPASSLNSTATNTTNRAVSNPNTTATSPNPSLNPPSQPPSALSNSQLQQPKQPLSSPSSSSNLAISPLAAMGPESHRRIGSLDEITTSSFSDIMAKALSDSKKELAERDSISGISASSAVREGSLAGSDKERANEGLSVVTEAEETEKGVEVGAAK